MDLNAFVNANKEWITRAGGRWAAASVEINKGSYEAKHLIRDLYKSWVDDPLEWWSDILQESESTRILIPVQGLGTGKSQLIPVPNPVNTKITSLVRLGGNQEMVEGVGNNVVLDKPAANPGMVQVTLQNLTTGAHPAGQYLGFIYEDQSLLATVVALR